MKKFDISLYLVTDSALAKDRSILQIVKEALEGGATMVQLREKNLSSKLFLERAIELKTLTSSYGVPLIINDRLDIALAANADGLHIGQDDLPYLVARKILGKDKIIGLSVETIQQARAANDLDVDYIGVSPVFSTQTKTDIKRPLELDGLRQIANFSKHLIVGIGGISEANCREVIDAGANGIAVVSAIICAESPTKTTQILKQKIKRL